MRVYTRDMDNNYESLPNVFPARRGDAEKIEARLMRVLRQYASYEYAVNQWYFHGDGRPASEGGRGYSFPECIHGMSRHTAYDNICGPCEGGYGYWDYGRELDEAHRDLQWARSVSQRRFSTIVPLMGEPWARFSPTTRDELMGWAQQPLTDYR